MAFVVVLPEFVTVWKLGEVPLGQFVPSTKQTMRPFTKSAVVVTVFAETVSAFNVPPVALEKLSVVIVPLVEASVVTVPLSVVSVVALAVCKNAFVAKRFVLVVLVPVALVQVIPATLNGELRTRFWMVAVVETRLMIVPLVAEKFVPVADTNESDVIDPELIVAVWTPSVLIVPFVAFKFVANKLVDVLFVDVVFPKYPFQRFVALPSENARSVVGIKSDETVPETVSVEVTTKVDTFAPPNNESVVVVNAPRFVTVCNVSDSLVTAA
jgi:hypothetical protein